MMQTSPRGIARRVLLAAGALALVPFAAAAQTPTVDEVVNRYIDAIGGREAVLAGAVSRTVGKIAIPAAGMTGDVEVLVAGPRDMVQRSSIAGFGESQTGLTDGRAWSIDPMQGARLVEGPEAEQMVHTADPTVALRAAHHFATREVVGERDVEGETCIEVRFVWTSGREMVDCFSVESGLLISSHSTIEGPMGSMQITTRALEYREFGSILMPTVLLQDLGPFQQRVEIELVEYGNVTKADVAPPAAIRTLLDG
jgi:hypothetical protein